MQWLYHSSYWLNMDVKLVDARLGWIQRQFQLPVEEVRILITKEPRIIAFGLGPIQVFAELSCSVFGYALNLENRNNSKSRLWIFPSRSQAYNAKRPSKFYFNFMVNYWLKEESLEPFLENCRLCIRH